MDECKVEQTLKEHGDAIASMREKVDEMAAVMAVLKPLAKKVTAILTVVGLLLGPMLSGLVNRVMTQQQAQDHPVASAPPPVSTVRIAQLDQAQKNAVDEAVKALREEMLEKLETDSQN